MPHARAEIIKTNLFAVDLIRNDKWLNDQDFAFFFKLFAMEVHPSQRVLFVPPSVSMMFKLDSNLAHEALSALEAATKDLILFAVNDDESGIRWWIRWEPLVPVVFLPHRHEL